MFILVLEMAQGTMSSLYFKIGLTKHEALGNALGTTQKLFAF